MFEHIAVRRKPGSVIEGILSAGECRFSCVTGKGGTSIFKREGDGATPAHRQMRPVSAYWRPDRLAHRPQCALPLRAITANDGWCDDPVHAAYNQPVQLPFVSSHEVMMRDDCLYDLCIVLDWNMPPVRSRGRGSAIFMHVAKPGFPPTAGCIALALPDLLHVAARISLKTQITVLRQA